MLRIPNPKVRDVNLIQSLKSDQRTPQMKKLHNTKLCFIHKNITTLLKCYYMLHYIPYIKAYTNLGPICKIYQIYANILKSGETTNIQYFWF